VPPSWSSRQIPVERRSCQTMARWTASPVSRSQRTTVSRWFVIPTPSTRKASRFRAASSASRPTRRVTSQISSASCSTHPDRGKYWRNSE
jgi:hypothetical protein